MERALWRMKYSTVQAQQAHQLRITASSAVSTFYYASANTRADPLMHRGKIIFSFYVQQKSNSYSEFVSNGGAFVHIWKALVDYMKKKNTDDKNNFEKWSSRSCRTLYCWLTNERNTLTMQNSCHFMAFRQCAPEFAIHDEFPRHSIICLFEALKWTFFFFLLFISTSLFCLTMPLSTLDGVDLNCRRTFSRVT